MAMRSVLGGLLATLGGVVTAFGAFGLAATIHTSERLSFGVTAIQVVPPAAVGVLLVYGASVLARWSDRSLVFCILAAASGAALIFLGLKIGLALADSPSGVAEAARPFLSAGAVLLIPGAAFIMYHRALQGVVHPAELAAQRRDAPRESYEGRTARLLLPSTGRRAFERAASADRLCRLPSAATMRRASHVPFSCEGRTPWGVSNRRQGRELPHRAPLGGRRAPLARQRRPQLLG
jgi:hypothetical protein